MLGMLRAEKLQNITCYELVQCALSKKKKKGFASEDSIIEIKLLANPQLQVLI